MKILGIDYGDARTGLSVSDPTGLIAGSPSVIAEWNRDKLLEKLTAYIRDNRIETIVLGYPKNMDGSVGARAEKCAALAEDLKARTGVPVVLWDERRTTVEAHQILREAGKKDQKTQKECGRCRSDPHPARLSGRPASALSPAALPSTKNAPIWGIFSVCRKSPAKAGLFRLSAVK